MTTGDLSPIWQRLTALGDLAVLLPCVLITAAWLAAKTETRRLAGTWLLFQLSIVAVVVGSKLLYMAWGIGIRAWDFTGLSGHSTMAATIWPCLFSALVPRTHRWPGFAFGWGLAAWVAWSRIELGVHSMAEVLSGLAFGGCAALAYVRHMGSVWRFPARTYGAVLAMVVLILLVIGGRFPSERWLRSMAQFMSLHHTIYARRDLRGEP